MHRYFSHVIDAHESSLKGERAVVLDHYQRSTPGFDFVHQFTASRSPSGLPSRVAHSSGATWRT
jgi:hypothetical protein